MLRFWLVAAAGVAAATAAHAQVDPRCVGMKEPVACTCALATGGTVSGRTWARGRGDTKAAFESCQAERGGTVAPRQQTIPAPR